MRVSGDLGLSLKRQRVQVFLQLVVVHLDADRAGQTKV